MSRDDFKRLKSGVVKRKTKRRMGLFIDGTGLDRATRRLERKVDLSRLVSGVTAGLVPSISRYYSLVPYEDDARQFAFLDAVERAGLEVIIKRLPPKGVKRQVSMDVHIATDIIAYSLGQFDTPSPSDGDTKEGDSKVITMGGSKAADGSAIKRLAAVVCPGRELGYSIFMSHKAGTETHLADFGLYGSSDGWKGVDRWIDLSTSETIWRD